MAKAIGTIDLIRPVAVAAAMIGSLQAASANPSFTLRCNPVADTDAAAAADLCQAFADAVTQSSWGKSGAAVAMQLDINTLRANAMNVTLNLTTANGGAHTINRAFSASDTTITPAMRDAFLQKLISAIPQDQ